MSEMEVAKEMQLRATLDRAQEAEARAEAAEWRAEVAERTCAMYEALCKSLERILWGNDMGRSRDEIEERVARLSVRPNTQPGKET